MTFPKYPHILDLTKRPDIFAVKEVVCTEKLHGSSFRVFFPLGMTDLKEIRYGSHETEYGVDETFTLNKAVLWFQNRIELLNKMVEVIKSYGFSDVTVFGEAYGPGIKAKGIKYSNGQEMLFRAFGIMVEENFLTYDLFVEVTDKMGLPRVHEVWRGEPTQENLDALLERPSAEGLLNGIDNTAEGVVIQTNPLFRDVFGEWVIAKHKSKKFAEKAHAREVKGPREASSADEFAATFVTEGRLSNVLGHLEDRGAELTHSMKDMPVILKEMIADLHKECQEEWNDLSLDEKSVTGSVSKVLAPLYRTYITKDE
jgi:Rnl2 family RNA ligase